MPLSSLKSSSPRLVQNEIWRVGSARLGFVLFVRGTEFETFFFF